MTPDNTIDIGLWISMGVRSIVLAAAGFIAFLALPRLREDVEHWRLALFALMIVVGVGALWMGGAARIWPVLTDAARAVGVVAGGALLIGILMLAVSYARGEI